jgi:hypothetical protein
MMGRRFATSLMARAVLAVGLVAGSFPAVAQSVEDLPVKERPRPEYDPVGLRWTNVFFYPAMGLSEVYDDNVFASEDDETDDFITILSPSLAIRSDGTRGGWQAGLNGNFGFYASEHDENYSDLSASLGGRYDVLPDGTLSLDGGYARLHEDRSSPDDAKGTEPTLYRRGNLHAGYGHRFNRLGTRLDLAALA